LGFRNYINYNNISVLDFVIPAKGTKKWRQLLWGMTTIGLIVGILAPIPFGFLIGPLLAH
jgi:uncharacterized protein YqgC (DUF456 family)